MGLSLITKALKALSSLSVAANKIPYFSSASAASSLDLVDEDTMSSDSATALPTQQSVKAYVDAEAGCKLLETIEIANASSTVTIGAGAITDDYTRYVIEISGLQISSSSNTTIDYEVSTNGGSSWTSSGYYSVTRHMPITSAGADDTDRAANAAVGLLVGTAAEGVNKITMDLSHHADTGALQGMTWEGVTRLSGGNYSRFFGGTNLSTLRVNAIRLSAGSGTIDDGLVKVYGYK